MYKRQDYKWLGNIFIITSTEQKFKFNNFLDTGSSFFHTVSTDKKKTGRNSINFNVQKLEWHEDSLPFNVSDYHYGVVCHQNCYKLLHKFLKYKLKFANVCRLMEDWATVLKPISKYGAMKKYIGQVFEWGKAHNENSWLLKNPLKNVKNRTRILKIWKPLIKRFNKKPPRPSPCESAIPSKYGIWPQIDEIWIGYDKKLWIVKGTKKKQRWVRLPATLKNELDKKGLLEPKSTRKILKEMRKESKKKSKKKSKKNSRKKSKKNSRKKS